MKFAFSLTAAVSLLSAIEAFPINFGVQNALALSEELSAIKGALDFLGSDDNNEEATDEDKEYVDGRFAGLPLIDTDEFQQLISAAGLEARANVLYNISKESIKKYGHPTRVIGSPGHWSTLGYITKELRKLGGYYNVTTQSFLAIDGKVNAVSLLIDGVKPLSLEALLLTPPTPHYRPVHGNLVLANGEGCNVEDYPASTNNSIVLIKRGVCAFGDKSVSAGKAGALGAIIYDPAGGALHGTLGTPTGEEIATVSISKEDAQQYIDQLLANPDAEILTTLYVNSYVKNITTKNVIAETVLGDHNNVVLLGAHSDSVEAGPGINDDGSGTISLLEVATLLSNYTVNNAVRFAWWAAEEEGLLGSTYYAESLSPEENQKLRFFLDYDMMASPNYEYEVYNANNVDHPNGSGDIKDFFIDWYTANGYNYTLVPFDGRSDYVGFIDAGIPAGGIATGAEGIKDAKSKADFGGKVGHQFDDCYHQLCDDLLNPSYEAWVANTKLIAHSVAYFAKSFDGFPAREPVELKTAAAAAGSAFARRGDKFVI